jgi:hypothetical protein
MLAAAEYDTIAGAFPDDLEMRVSHRCTAPTVVDSWFAAL